MLKKEFLRLLKEDEEFRHAVAGLIGYEELLEGQREIRAQIKKLWEEVKELRLGQEKLWEKYDQLAKGQEKLWEKYDQLAKGQEKLWEKYDQLAKGQEKLWEEVRGIKMTLGAIGARWGIMSESAFRETLRGLLAKELKAKVEKWVHNDTEGYVFGYPAVVDIDIMIKNGRVIALEVTSHARASDVTALKKKAELYERVTGRKIDEVVISSPFIDASAREAAEKLGVKIYTAE
jgi:hypothetical protein